MFLGCLYGEQYGPRSDCSLGVHLNICSRHHFKDKLLACLELPIVSTEKQLTAVTSKLISIFAMILSWQIEHALLPMTCQPGF